MILLFFCVLQCPCGRAFYSLKGVWWNKLLSWEIKKRRPRFIFLTLIEKEKQTRKQNRNYSNSIKITLIFEKWIEVKWQLLKMKLSWKKGKGQKRREVWARNWQLKKVKKDKEENSERRQIKKMEAFKSHHGQKVHNFKNLNNKNNQLSYLLAKISKSKI